MAGFTLSVTDILGRPGAYRDFVVDHPVEGVDTALAHLDTSPAHAELRAESVVEGILVTGHIAAHTRLECARCLKGFSGSVDIEVCELFVAPGHENVADDDTYRVAGTDIDLEPMVRDALVLALPLNPLCEDACKGLCARCGRHLTNGACDCEQEELDPRWAALSQLKDRMKEA